MNHLAQTATQSPVFHEWARVLAVKGRQCRLRSEAGTYDAIQAVSCLLSPQVGDHVLAAIAGPDHAYVLSILEREGHSEHQINLQGDVRLSVRQGRLKITSQEGLDLASARDIRTMSEDININAVRGQVNVHRGTFQGDHLQARIGSVQWLADSVNSVVARLTQRFKRLYRTVDEFEQVKAGRMDVLVKKLFSVRSQYTVMTAKEDVKVDGERIHIG